MRVMVAVALLLPFSSCVDEVLESKKDSEILEGDGNFLKFKVSLQNLTRDGGNISTGTQKKEVDEEYEDFIDEESLRVLFFYADENNPNYNKLFAKFEPGEFSLIPISNTLDNGQENWYVRIPVSDFNSTFVETVKENNFKIAVLANWPKNDESDIAISKSDDINMLHRQVIHDAYNSTEAAKDAYRKILDGEGKLGLTTSWVKDGPWKDEDCAEEFLRTTCYPGGDNAEEYGHLWMYWNFASIIQGNEPPADEKNHHKWFGKNMTDLRSWLTDLNNNKLKNFTPENAVTGNFVYKGENAYIDSNSEGIVLPQVGQVDYNKKDYIRITIPASGNLRIKWGSATNGNQAQIRVERRNHIDEDESAKDYPWPGSTTSRDAEEINWDIDVTGDEEYISIFSTEGNVIIYEIEYIGVSYLGNIDSKGVNPKDQYIPMYGVQVFNKLDNLWIEGTSFDLSNFNMTGPNSYLDGNTGQMVIPYEYRSISLIRSVAKVVLKIPIKEKPHHIFLRNMNSQAFCEPLDVSTPTHLLWEDDVENEGYSTHNPNCEFFSIKGQPPFYKGSEAGSDKVQQMSNYSEKLAWYYGAWGIESNPTEKMEEVNHRKAAEYYDAKFPADFKEGRPHIFNPMIERSDFCEFLYAGEVEGLYKKYVLYVPEKFVDDPNKLDEKDGIETSDPKVCHIEFRTLSSPFKNLDDNNCYRIYFTENGFNKYYLGRTDDDEGHTPPTFGKVEGGVYDTWENRYENNVENLKVHWPILRNHVYSFTVLDAESAMLVVQLEIVPWKQVDENRYNW